MTGGGSLSESDIRMNLTKCLRERSERGLCPFPKRAKLHE